MGSEYIFWFAEMYSGAIYLNQKMYSDPIYLARFPYVVGNR
jgi:hypothetical protein